MGVPGKTYSGQVGTRRSGEYLVKYKIFVSKRQPQFSSGTNRDNMKVDSKVSEEYV